MIALLIVSAIAAPPPYASSITPEFDSLVSTMESHVGERRAKRERESFKSIAGAVLDAGYRENIHPLFLLAVAWTESRWAEKVRPGDHGKSFGIYQMTFAAGRCVQWAGMFGGELQFTRSGKLRQSKIYALEEVWHSSLIAAAFWAHLRRKYKDRADVVYNCGPIRCGRGKSMRKRTPATIKYWKTYRKLRRICLSIDSGCLREREG